MVIYIILVPLKSWEGGSIPSASSSYYRHMVSTRALVQAPSWSCSPSYTRGVPDLENISRKAANSVFQCHQGLLTHRTNPVGVWDQRRPVFRKSSVQQPAGIRVPCSVSPRRLRKGNPHYDRATHTSGCSVPRKGTPSIERGVIANTALLL